MPHDTLPLQTRRRTLADWLARTAGRAAHPGDIVDVHGIVADECHHDAVGHLLDRAAQHLDGPHGALPFAAPSRVFVEHEHSRALSGTKYSKTRLFCCRKKPSFCAETAEGVAVRRLAHST